MPPSPAPGAMPAVNRVTTPAVVMRPIAAVAPDSVNHSAPSEPAAIPRGAAPAVSGANSITTPAGVMRPMRFWLVSANQRLPSGPAAIPPRPAPRRESRRELGDRPGWSGGRRGRRCGEDDDRSHQGDQSTGRVSHSWLSRPEGPLLPRKGELSVARAERHYAGGAAREAFYSSDRLQIRMIYRDVH